MHGQFSETRQGMIHGLGFKGKAIFGQHHVQSGSGDFAKRFERAARIQGEGIAQQSGEPEFQGFIGQPKPMQARTHGFKRKQSFDDIKCDNLRTMFHFANS